MNQLVDIVWTDERVAELRRLWVIEGLSCSAIAARLGEGITRNAVIGKLHRLGINRPGGTPKLAAPRSRGVGNPGQPKAVAILKRVQKRTLDNARKAGAVEVEPEARKLLRSEIWKPLDGCTPLPIEVLGTEDCRWPLGDPLEHGFGYCGLPREGEHTRYCATHRRIATQGAG